MDGPRLPSLSPLGAPPCRQHSLAYVIAKSQICTEQRPRARQQVDGEAPLSRAHDEK